MGERRILLIGSQCDALNSLSFLPTVAEDLYEVMIDPRLGGCVPALESNGLLLDPSVDASRKAVEIAFQRASKDEATLFLVFIGHGEWADEDFYLLPKDASIPPRAHTAIHLVQLIKELHREHSYVDGLVVLLDTCYAGVAATGAATQWTRGLHGTLRFEMLTAVADRPAADGCFSRSLAQTIRTGVVDVQSEYLRCEKVKPIIEDLCPNQTPHLPTWDSDDGLYLAKNVAQFSSNESWIRTRAAAEIERLAWCFQPTPQLEELVVTTETKRYVALTGLAGAGKSALAAALVRPGLTAGRVPEGFVQAIFFISEGITSGDLARELSEQLMDAVPGFAQAREQFRSEMRPEELAQLDSLQQEVLRPLRLLNTNHPVRIVLDGLDLLSPGSALPVNSLLEALGTDPELPAVRLLVTSRPDTPLPATPERIDMGRTDDRSIVSYLERRETPSIFQEVIVKKASGNWLIARLLADLASIPGIAVDEALPSSLAEIYHGVLRRAADTDSRRWRDESRPVLSVLAAAGVGPVLPLQLLCAASQILGGPSGTTRVRDVLVDFRGFVVRGKPGTDDEQIGVFHQTFGEYLLDPAAGEFGSDAKEAHAALLEAIAELAPIGNQQQNMSSPLQRYSAAAEAEHFWAIGKYAEAMTGLFERTSSIPAENLTRWKSWYDRANCTLGPNSEYTLAIRNNIASWTGRTGNWGEALRLFQELLPDAIRALGPDHPYTLLTRNNIAQWTGETGNGSEALRLLQKLFPDQIRVLGSDHPETLRVRNNIAGWTGETGNGGEALRLFQELLPDQIRVLGPDNPETLLTRNNIGNWTEKTGNKHEALRLFQELLPVRERVLGPNHPGTLNTRKNIANLVGRTGNVREALRLFQELLPDQIRVLGPNHPDTLVTRFSIADWTGETGDGREVLRSLQGLLLDQIEVLGQNHPRNLLIRQKIAYWTGETGNSAEALRLFQELLPDEVRALGADHQETLHTRASIAHWTGETGNGGEALRLFQELHPDQVRALGADHPEALGTRASIVNWTGQTGNWDEALRLSEELFPHQVSVLGPDHPDALITRAYIAHWIGLKGDGREALDLFEELLPDQVRALGADHRETLRTRTLIGFWIGETGNGGKALRLFQELLPDQVRVLGPDHPGTLLTRGSIARWTGETGDPQGALRLFQGLLPDQVRVFGPDHPGTLLIRNKIAQWTAQTGNNPEALRLFQELLPDQTRVLGPDHLETLRTRNNVAHWIGLNGDGREALRLFQELLSDQIRVLGPDNQEVLITRNNIAGWTGEIGDARVGFRLFQELLSDQVRVLGPDHPDTGLTRTAILYWENRVQS
jgi:Tetratricopeptide repeat/NACHT domain